jgi:hypothetical protein
MWMIWSVLARLEAFIQRIEYSVFILRELLPLSSLMEGHWRYWLTASFNLGQSIILQERNLWNMIWWSICWYYYYMSIFIVGSIQFFKKIKRSTREALRSSHSNWCIAFSVSSKPSNASTVQRSSDMYFWKTKRTRSYEILDALLQCVWMM